MEYGAVRIGNVTVKEEDVLLFEINGTDIRQYSVLELKKLYFEPNIRLKFKNNGELYCKDADMLFIFARDGKEKYMLEFELPYKTDESGENRCETTTRCGVTTYIEVKK